MKSTEQLKSRLHLSTASFLIAAMSATVTTGAIAQDTDAAAEEELLGIEEVVITGSRIKRTGFDTVAPATVVDSEFLDIRGFDNVATALNELPGFFNGISNNGNQSSQSVGQNFVNAFGLGTQRTLTLINGRRTVGQNSPTLVGTGAGAGLQVDLNIIPTALVERVETVFTGGAPIYGSDAIAGTVNLIMKDDFEGLSVEGQYGFSHQGDGENYRLRSTVGGNFSDDRGNVVVSLEYSKQDGLIGTDRPEYVNGWRPNCTNRDPNVNFNEVLCQDASTVWQVPSTGFIVGESLPFMLPGFGNSLTDADGNPVMFDLDGGLIRIADTNPGDTSRGNPGIFFSEGADPLNNPYYLTIAGETTSIRSPLERYMMMSMAHYDISDNVRLYMESLYSRTESEDVANQPTWGTNFFAPTQDALRINIAENPFVSEELRTLATDQGFGDYFVITRNNDDFMEGGRNFRDQEVFRYVVGLEGTFEALDREWSWDVAYTFGQTHATSAQSTVNFDLLALGVDAIAIQDDAMLAATGVDAGNFAIRNGVTTQISAANPLRVGDIVCRSTHERPDDPLQGGAANQMQNNDIERCVPVNVQGYNVMTDEAREYVVQEQLQLSTLQQSVVEASISGSLFDLPAGELGFAMGVTHRSESGSFTGGQGSESGINPNSPVQNVSGGFNTDEIYGELFVPLISDTEGMGVVGDIIENWSIEAALRYVDNSRAGGDYTWTVGTRLTPNLLDGSFTFRANYTEAIRAPSIPELFAPSAGSFFFASDPCDTRFIGQGNNASTREANCIADLNAEFAAGRFDPTGIMVPSNPDDATSAQVALDMSNPDLVRSFLLNVHQSLIVNASQPGTQGGNPDLLNENSKAWSLGMIIEPVFIPGLTLSVDWTDIEISNVMITPTATQLANACYDNSSFPTVLVGTVNACDTWARDSGFDFISPRLNVVNAAVRNFAGLTVNGSYSFDLASISESLPGSMNITGNYFYLHEDETTTAGSEDANIRRNEFNAFKHNINLAATYSVDKFSWLLQWRHTSSYIPSNEHAEDRRNIKHIPAWNVFNTTLRYQLNENLAARVVVNNLLDDRGDSPIEQAYNIRDQIGRTYLFAITADF